MATTTAKKKPTTTKKPKATAKKTAAKSTKTSSKSVSKKVTKTTKKPAEVKSSVSSAKRVVGPFEKLRAIHFSNFFSGIILAILTLVFVNPINKDLFLDYQARDLFVQSDNVNLGPATEFLFSVDIRYLLVTLLGLTSLISLIIATKLYRRYEASVKSGISGFRWLLYSLVGVLVLEFVSLTAGVQDIMLLKVSSGLIILAGLLAWFSERENAGAKKPKKLAFYGSVFAHFMAVLPVLVSLIATPIISGERFAGYVYVLVAILVLGYALILLNMRAAMLNKKNLEYVAYEQRYLRIDQIVKFVIVLTIFATFNK